MGRPRWEPSREQRKYCVTLAGMGMTHSNIAKVFGSSEPTLRSALAKELDEGLANVESRVVGRMFKLACSKNETIAFKAAEFIMRCHPAIRKWGDRTALKVSGPDGKPIQVQGMSFEERAAKLRQLFNAMTDPKLRALVDPKARAAAFEDVEIDGTDTPRQLPHLPRSPRTVDAVAVERDSDSSDE